MASGSAGSGKLLFNYCSNLNRINCSIPSADAEADFVWIDGTAMDRFGANKWATKEAPKNTPGDCMLILPRTSAHAGKWATGDCGVKLPYFCATRPEMDTGRGAVLKVEGSCEK